jgi:hypothetical protein
MSEQSATTTLPHKSIRGSVTVGDYLNSPAAAAVRAVRRVGLSPGLDRQFGGEPQTIGLVVAQDPQAGSEIARGAMVTLYVSAPAAGAPDEPQARSEVASEERDQVSEIALHPEVEPQAAHAPAVSATASPARPRRKRRARPSATGEGGHPQAPVPTAAPPPEMLDERDDQRAPTHQHDPEANITDAEPAWDQLTFEMRNVFAAGPLGLARRSLYPRKPLSLRAHTCSAWVRGHKASALTACAVLALAMSLGATREQTASSRTTGPIAASAPPARRSTSLRTTPAARTHPPQLAPAAPGHRHTHAARRARPHATAGTPAPASPPSPPVPAAPETAPQRSAPGSAPAAPSGGGPFSP